LRNYRSGRQPDPTKSIALNASPLGAARSRRRGLAGTTGRGPGPSPPQHHRLDGKGTATDGGRRAGTYRRVQRGDLQLSRIEAGAYDHGRSEEHTSELQSREKLVCRLLLEKKKERQ